MKEFKDQMHQTIRLSEMPRRIVSLVPSQTELLYDLGLKEEVVGITKFCIYPDEWYRSKKRVGGTKDVSLDKLISLQPDLIIGNKEENEQSNILEIQQHFPIWMSDIFNLEDAYEMIIHIGELIDKKENALNLVSKIRNEFTELEVFVNNTKANKKLKVAYFIWNKPYYIVGQNTFVNSMLEMCGFENFTHLERYPTFEFEENNLPDLIFLSSEPYPFKQKHIDLLQKKYPSTKVFLVDGEMFSWYGSRLQYAPKYFIELLKTIYDFDK